MATPVGLSWAAVQIKVKASPSGSVLREPSRITWVPASTDWSGPALALGGRLAAVGVGGSLHAANNANNVNNQQWLLIPIGLINTIIFSDGFLGGMPVLLQSAQLYYECKDPVKR